MEGDSRMDRKNLRACHLTCRLVQLLDQVAWTFCTCGTSLASQAHGISVWYLKLGLQSAYHVWAFGMASGQLPTKPCVHPWTQSW